MHDISRGAQAATAVVPQVQRQRNKRRQEATGAQMDGAQKIMLLRYCGRLLEVWCLNQMVSRPPRSVSCPQLGPKWTPSHGNSVPNAETHQLHHCPGKCKVLHLWTNAITQSGSSFQVQQCGVCRALSASLRCFVVSIPESLATKSQTHAPNQHRLYPCNGALAQRQCATAAQCQTCFNIMSSTQHVTLTLWPYGCL